MVYNYLNTDILCSLKKSNKKRWTNTRINIKSTHKENEYLLLILTWIILKCVMLKGSPTLSSIADPALHDNALFLVSFLLPSLRLYILFYILYYTILYIHCHIFFYILLFFNSITCFSFYWHSNFLNPQ